jgi:hypothetical protein
MKRVLFVFLLAFFMNTIYSQFYPVSLIPDSLNSGASLIIRDELRNLELQSLNSGKETYFIAQTILNKDGEDFASLALLYDKNSTIKINEIVYYDKNGEKIRNVKMSEVTDNPASGLIGLYTDKRLKYFRPSQPVYPYTVKYEYEIDRNNIISFGSWKPLSYYDVSVQHSVFRFIHPLRYQVNKKEIKIKSLHSETQSDPSVETWEVNNLKALEDEPYDIDLSERTPSVYLMPSVLKYDNYTGTGDNWINYGKWINALYKGRNEISDVEKIKVATLIKEIPDTLERIKTLYKYLQSNTRFVSITLGLGGYQPFDAKTVFETGYGDCKALSNYMCSLLKSIGVKSYTAIVSSGTYKEPIFKDFPNFQQFDHAILCVPRIHDTIWLECTNQKIPFGFLGDFTDDRDVLLITEDGGKFAHTIRYEANDNVRSCRSIFNIDSTGSALCTIRTIYKGLQYENISTFLFSNSDEQKKWLYSNSNLPSLKINSFSVNDNHERMPVASLTQTESSNNFCSFSGNYMILSLNLLNAQKAIKKMLKPRHSDILIDRSSIDYDTLIYKIPKHYKYESIPASITLNTKFGDYAFSVSASENEIICVRKFSILEGRYKPADYKQFYDFILSISKADNTKVILTKKS